jgi:hypothetical protein
MRCVPRSMPLTFLIWIGRRYEMIFGDRLLIFYCASGFVSPFCLAILIVSLKLRELVQLWKER